MSEASPISQAVGEQLRSWRESAGLLQEDVAREARNCGLDWTAATVGVIETGRRNVTLWEFLVLPLIVSAFPHDEVQFASLGEFLGPYGPLLSMPATEEERAKHRDLADTVDVYASRNSIAVEAQGQAERRAAESLGVSRYDIPSLARTLWGRSLTAERDARAVDAAGIDASPRSVQAHRGHVTRELLEEMRERLQEIRREWDRHAKRLWGRSFREEIDARVADGEVPRRAEFDVRRAISDAMEGGEDDDG